MAAQNRHAIRRGQLPWALAGLVFLCLSAAVGFNLKTRLLKPGTTETVIDFVTVLTGFLATTAAIVMGLLINSAKTFVDAARDHWATYAGQLLRLDQCMRNYGTESEPIRAQLQSFTAAGIANFWRHESAPTGLTYPDVRNMSPDEVSLTLNELLNNVKLGILRLQPPDPLHEKLAADCLEQYKKFADTRWSLLLEVQHPMPAAFFRVLMFWLMIIFVCFGIRAPDHPVAIAMIALAATTLTSMMFAVRDMVNPYEGIYNIPSRNVRRALDVMLHFNPAN